MGAPHIQIETHYKAKVLYEPFQFKYGNIFRSLFSLKKSICENSNAALHCDTLGSFLASDNLRRNVQLVEVSQSNMFDHKIVSLYLSNNFFFCHSRV